MSDTNAVQLATLWFAVLVFLHTDGGDVGPVAAVAGLLAVLLAYVLPLTIVVRLALGPSGRD